MLDAFSHLGTFDVVFCRNVRSISTATKSEVLDRLARVVDDDGLFVSVAAETWRGLTKGFNVVRGPSGM